MQRNESIPENIIAAIKAGNDSKVTDFIRENPNRLNAVDANGKSMLEHAIENDKIGLAIQLTKYPEFDIKQLGGKKIVELCETKSKNNNAAIENALTEAEKKPFVDMNRELTNLKNQVGRLLNTKMQEATDKKKEQAFNDMLKAGGGKEKFASTLVKAADAAEKKKIIVDQMSKVAGDDPKARVKFLEDYEKKNPKEMKDKVTKGIVNDLKKDAKQQLKSETFSNSNTSIFKSILKGKTKDEMKKVISSDLIDSKNTKPEPTIKTEKASPVVTQPTKPETSSEQKESYSSPGLGRRK